MSLIPYHSSKWKENKQRSSLTPAIWSKEIFKKSSMSEVHCFLSEWSKRLCWKSGFTGNFSYISSWYSRQYFTTNKNKSSPFHIMEIQGKQAQNHWALMLILIEMWLVCEIGVFRRNWCVCMSCMNMCICTLYHVISANLLSLAGESRMARFSVEKGAFFDRAVRNKKISTINPGQGCGALRQNLIGQTSAYIRT